MAKTKISKLKEKATEGKAKREQKKLELAMHTLATLSQLGYANTSLRDIAEQSEVSVGVLHYYFEDKNDLIAYCVRLYKDEFINRLEVELKLDRDHEQVISEIVENLVDTIRDDSEAHRLWYDMRLQAMFNESFQKVVRELEDALIGLSRRFLDRLGLHQSCAMDCYLSVDARFRYYLQRYFEGDEQAIGSLRKSLTSLFQSFLIGSKV